MLIRTSSLINLPLNWAVAVCQGYIPQRLAMEPFTTVLYSRDGKHIAFLPSEVPDYSGKWAHGGFILEAEGITTGPHTTSPAIAHYGPAAVRDPHEDRWVGPTLLIAGMRCYVIKHMGMEIELPDELFNVKENAT